MDIKQDINKIKEALSRKEEKPDEATKPLEESVPVAPAVDPDFVDRSNFNCDNCGGEGLVRDEASHTDKICPQCLGKGKIN